MYYDDISGAPLKADPVEEAMQEEMEQHRAHEVYTKVPIARCYERTGKKPVGVRWVITNEGDDITPNVRARLVAKEIKADSRLDMFAATPPLEAKKLLLSMACTEGIGFKAGQSESGMKLDFIDVRRAYFHCKARPKVYVQLPKEDESRGMCGRLNKSMYGSRYAAQNWEFAYCEFMTNSGFTEGLSTPCAFYHAENDIRCVIHGDDFTLLGHGPDLDWFGKKIQERFEVKFRGRLGPAASDEKSIIILNRIVSWTSEGIEYEPDQRHAEIIVDARGLEKRQQLREDAGRKRPSTPPPTKRLRTCPWTGAKRRHSGPLWLGRCT